MICTVLGQSVMRFWKHHWLFLKIHLMLCEKSIKYSNFYIVLIFFGMHGLLYENDIYQSLFAQPFNHPTVQPRVSRTRKSKCFSRAMSCWGWSWSPGMWETKVFVAKGHFCSFGTKSGVNIWWTYTMSSTWLLVVFNEPYLLSHEIILFHQMRSSRFRTRTWQGNARSHTNQILANAINWFYFVFDVLYTRQF